MFFVAVLVGPILAGAMFDWCFGVSPMFTIIGASFSLAEIMERLLNRIGTAGTRYSKPDLDDGNAI